MEYRVVFREDADWNHFPYPENFWTSLVAAALLKARNCPGSFGHVPMWWKEEREPDGNLAELIAGPFDMEIFKPWALCRSAPDIRLESRDWIVIVETKRGAPIEPKQFDVFDCLGKAGSRNATYLLMAPGSFRPGQLGKFYENGKRTRIKAGFLDLALTVNWGWNLLDLGAPCWEQK